MAIVESLQYTSASQSDRSEAAIKQYAKTCRIKQLIWIEGDGNPKVETLVNS